MSAFDLRFAQIQASCSSAQFQPLKEDQDFQVLCRGIYKGPASLVGTALLPDLDEGNDRQLVIKPERSKDGKHRFLSASTVLKGKSGKEACWVNLGSLWIQDTAEVAEVSGIEAAGQLWKTEVLVRSWGFTRLQLRRITHEKIVAQDGSWTLAPADASILGTMELIAY